MCMTCSMFNPFGGDWLHSGATDRTIEEADLPGGDAPDEASTSVQIFAGDTFNGELDVALDWDWFYVEFEAGQTYTVTLEPGTLSDPYIWIADQNGVRFTSVDEGYSGDPEVFVYTALTSGSGYIVVDSYFNTINETSSSYGSDTGTYTLSVTAAPTPPPPAPGTSDPLASIDGSYVAPSVIDVYFVPGGITFNDGVAQTTSEWDAFDQQQAMLAFQLYANVANVTFNAVTDPTEAEFFMVESTDPDSSLGYWWPGGREVTLDGVTYNPVGVGVHYSGGPGWDANGLEQGGFGFITMLHEIGHGMGLMHPHDTGGGSTVMSGVTIVSRANYTRGHFDLNQGIYTTMTYNDGWQTAPHGVSPSDNYGFQGTPMAFDVAVLQATYGANMTYNTGDDTYVLPTANAPGTFYAAIWDAGGTDTIVHNGTAPAVIDLREAPLISDVNGGGYVSYARNIHGGFTIAAGAEIENATGGSGADTIIGNDLGNVILGRQGNDWIEGGAGNDEIRGNLNADTIHGGDGFDTLYGGAGFDVIYGGANADCIYGGDLNDALHGELGNDFVVGQAGNDTIWGGDGFDTLRGGADDDLLHGGARGDQLIGGLGNDTVHGDDGNDRLEGNAGADSLDGGLGEDALFGAAGNDTLFGGADNDRLFGGADEDLIEGGTGNDTMFGGFGTDTFVFGADHGTDVIRDFNANGELIDLTRQVVNFGDLIITDEVADAVVTGVGPAALVVTAGGSILLEGVLAADLSQDDFLFALPG